MLTGCAVIAAPRLGVHDEELEILERFAAIGHSGMARR
jgi:hypothetical protein